MNNYRNEAEKMMASLGGIVKREGVFSSLKQKKFLLSFLPEIYGYFNIAEAGLTPVEGKIYITITNTIRWADYGTRSVRQVGSVYEMDEIGISRQWKLHWNVSNGCSTINAKKTELVFTRFDDVDTDHLIESEPVVEGDWIGEVGEKVDFIEVSLVKRFVRQSTFGYRSVASDVLIMEDIANGNLIVWSSSNSQSFEIGDEFEIAGTVKKQEIYNDRKQTVLTRCKIRNA